MSADPEDSAGTRELASRMEALDRVHEPVTHHLRGAMYATVLHLDLLRMTVDSLAEPDDDKRAGLSRRVAALQRQFTELRNHFERWMTVVRPPRDPIETLDLRAALSDVVLVVEGLAGTREVQLRADLPEDGPRPHVAAQPQRLRLVLLQFLLRAVDGARRSVRLEVDAPDGHAIVRIIGDGSAADMKHDRALLVAQEVLREFRGAAVLEPEVEGGTVIEIRLPAAPAPPPTPANNR
jgi:signal transduction histidine kinase